MFAMLTFPDRRVRRAAGGAGGAAAAPDAPPVPWSGRSFAPACGSRTSARSSTCSTVLPDTRLRGVRIYEFDGDMTGLVAVSEAAEGEYLPPNRWRLTDVVQTRFGERERECRARAGDRCGSPRSTPTSWRCCWSCRNAWPSRVSTSTSSTCRDNRQRTERYEIALWKKLVYPLAVAGDDGPGPALRPAPAPLRRGERARFCAAS
ncbi:MAG: hypothetical protein MZV65_48385 [Chromatiales bacterium]|nr:hypothetical protein [Chromatiales bacterium]